MTEPVRYAISGSRKSRDSYAIMCILAGLAWWKKFYREKVEVLVGDEPNGVDKIAYRIAQDMGLSPKQFVADWDEHGRGAGPRRNQKIIDAGPKVLFVFKDDFGKRRNAKGKMLGGTEDCARRAIRAGIPVLLIKRLTEEDVK